MSFAVDCPRCARPLPRQCSGMLDDAFLTRCRNCRITVAVVPVLEAPAERVKHLSDAEASRLNRLKWMGGQRPS